MAKSRRQHYNQLRMRNILMFTLILILSYIVKLLTSLDGFNLFVNQAFEFFQLSETHRRERDLHIPPTLPTPSSTSLPTTSSSTLPTPSSTTLPSTSSTSLPTPSTTLPTPSSTSLPTTSSSTLPTPSSTTLPTTSSTTLPTPSSTSSSTTLPTPSSTTLPTTSSTTLTSPSSSSSSTTLPTPSSTTLPTISSTTVTTTLKRIDWHDYALIDQERKRVGMGEQGKPAYLMSETNKQIHLEKSATAEYGFNVVLSTKIPLNRSLPDIRHPTCRKKLYIASLPSVSVVIPFYNEHWSTVLRTVFSVLLRSPSTLIKEVLLVDDASEKVFLKRKLEVYLAKNMPKVRIIRLDKRSGLIKARLAGAKEATADVLLFLDSHIEVNVNWLPPLLEPIALNYRTVTCPFIDGIIHSTLEYVEQDDGRRGAFDWEFFYKRLPVLPKDKANMPEPFDNPVMAGGLFAISRKFFWELGGYDPELKIWGGEQYELSFKIWQCGGRLVDVPCSRVGHIYRTFGSFLILYNTYLLMNYRRVADVWMDEYAQFLYARRPELAYFDPGDISEQIALRKKLQCKSFRWYMTQIAFDLSAKYPPVEPNVFARGRVRPVSDPTMCIDAHYGEKINKLIIKPCSTPEGENEFVFAWYKDIKFKSQNLCWDLPNSANKSPIILYQCHFDGGNQMWKYIIDTKQIHHVLSDNCIEYSPESKEVFSFGCDKAKDTQKWTIDHVDKEMMAKWSKIGARVTEPIPEESAIY